MRCLGKKKKKSKGEGKAAWWKFLSDLSGSTYTEPPGTSGPGSLWPPGGPRCRPLARRRPPGWPWRSGGWWRCTSCRRSAPRGASLWAGETDETPRHEERETKKTESSEGTNSGWLDSCKEPRSDRNLETKLNILGCFPPGHEEGCGLSVRLAANFPIKSEECWGWLSQCGFHCIATTSLNQESRVNRLSFCWSKLLFMALQPLCPVNSQTELLPALRSSNYLCLFVNTMFTKKIKKWKCV